METTISADHRQKEVNKNAGWVIGFGILVVVLGFLAIGSPLVAGIAVMYVIGSFVLIGGIARIIYALRAKSWGAGLLQLAGGGLWTFCGLALLFRPVFGLSVLTWVLGIVILIDGILRVVLSLQLQPLRGWAWTLFGGILGIVLGTLILSQWPLAGMWAIGTFLGINILFAGWSMIGLGVAAQSARAEAALEPTSPEQ